MSNTHDTDSRNSPNKDHSDVLDSMQSFLITDFIDANLPDSRDPAAVESSKQVAAIIGKVFREGYHLDLNTTGEYFRVTAGTLIGVTSMSDLILKHNIDPEVASYVIGAQLARLAPQDAPDTLGPEQSSLMAWFLKKYTAEPALEHISAYDQATTEMRERLREDFHLNLETAEEHFCVMASANFATESMRNLMQDEGIGPEAAGKSVEAEVASLAPAELRLYR